MPKRSPIDQLDDAIQAMLAPAAAPITGLDREVADLLPAAALLRDLPSPAFRARLKSQLERKANMSTSPAPSTAAIMRNPTGGLLPTVVPYLCVVEAHEVIELVQKAFGAQGAILGTGSQGGIHSEYSIGDAKVMIGGGPAWKNPVPRPAALHIYVDDADAVYARAMAAGATSLSPPADREYGDREAGVKDAGGNLWFIGQLRNRPRPEGLRAVTASFFAHGAVAFIDFLKQAFSGEEVARHASPDGTVLHAQVRVGDSIVEIGEAHGQWQPMPIAIYLSVADCDAVYEQSLKAGAESVSPPGTMPYGPVRGATIRDAGGNLWYIQQPLAPAKPSGA